MRRTCWRTFASAIVTLSLMSVGCGSKKGTSDGTGAGGATGGSGGAAGASAGGAGDASGNAGTGGAAGGSGTGGATGGATGGTTGGAAGGATGGTMGTAGAGGSVAAWSGTRILGTSAHDLMSGLAIDASGNIYIHGETGGALYGQTQGAMYDLFALKLNAAGAVQWAAQIAGAGLEQAGALALDRTGNVYITGSTYTSIDSRPSAGGFDVVLVKLDSSGAQQWIRQFGSTGFDYAEGVVTDAAGNVYVAGKVGDALPGSTSLGYDDAFLVKFDSAGTQQWARQFGTAAAQFVSDLAIDASGNLYVAGYASDPSGTLANAPEVGHVFLAKYDGAGTPQWTRIVASSGGERPDSVGTDVAGNVYVVGVTTGDFGGSGNAGNGDGFVIKYDGAGNQVWARQLGTAKSDEAHAVTTDAAGNVYVGGSTYGGFDTPPTGGISVAFVAKYDSAGTRAWLRQTPMNASHVSSVAVDPRGDVFISGRSDNAVDGVPGLGADDIFVMKYSADGVKY